MREHVGIAVDLACLRSHADSVIEGTVTTVEADPAGVCR